MLRLYLRNINTILRSVRPISVRSSKLVASVNHNFFHELPKPRINRAFFIAISLVFWKSKNDKEVDINNKPPFKKIIEIIKRGKLKEMRMDYNEAEELFHEALETLYKYPLEKLNELEISQTKSYIFDCLANLALLQNDLSKAEGLFKETLKESFFQKFDKDDNAIVEISLKLSMIYAAQERYDEAKVGYLFCIESMEKKLFKLEDYLTQADEDSLSLYGMASEAYSRYLNQRGKWKESLPYLERAFEIVRKVYIDAHPQVAVISNDLGVIKSLLDEQEQALQHFEYAAHIAKQCGSPDTPIILYNMAEMLIKIDELERSLEALKLALKSCNENTSIEVRNKILSTLHSTTSINSNTFGDSSQATGPNDSTKQFLPL